MIDEPDNWRSLGECLATVLTNLTPPINTPTTAKPYRHPFLSEGPIDDHA